MTQRNFAQKIVFKLLSKWVKCFIVQADIEMVATQYVKATICRLKTMWNCRMWTRRNNEIFEPNVG